MSAEEVYSRRFGPEYERNVARPVPRFALRPQEAADSVGVSLSTFLTWVDTGKMPKVIKVGGVALYDAESVRRAWEALKDAAGGDGVNPFD